MVVAIEWPIARGDRHGYVRTCPFFAERRIIAVEPTLEVTFLDRRWSTRPDALAVAHDGTVICLEASGARHPTANRTEVQTQAALDQLALRYSPTLPAWLRDQPHRVIIGALDSGSEFDVTMEWGEVETILSDVNMFLSELEGGYREPQPAKETCGSCPYTDCLARWPLATQTDKATR